MRHTNQRRDRRVWAGGWRHGSHRAVDLRLQRDPAHTDPVGHQPETRFVSGQLVSASEYAGQGSYGNKTRLPGIGSRARSSVIRRLLPGAGDRMETQ